MGDKASSGDDQVVIKEAAAWQEREPSQCLVNVVSSCMELLSPLFWSWKKEDAMKKSPEAMKEIFFLRSLQGRSCLVMSWQNLIPSSNSHITGIFWSFNINKTSFKRNPKSAHQWKFQEPFLTLDSYMSDRFVFCVEMFPVQGHSEFQAWNPSADGNDSLSPELSWANSAVHRKESRKQGYCCHP